MRYWILILVTVFSFQSYAQEQANQFCDRPDVFTLERPIYPDRSSSSTFSYKYQFYRGGSDQAPVIIFIPGGPGSPSISGAPESYPAVLPTFNIIYTDQRGSGCNDLRASSFPEDGYRAKRSSRTFQENSSYLRVS